MEVATFAPNTYVFVVLIIVGSLIALVIIGILMRESYPWIRARLKQHEQSSKTGTFFARTVLS